MSSINEQVVNLLQVYWSGQWPDDIETRNVCRLLTQQITAQLPSQLRRKLSTGSMISTDIVQSALAQLIKENPVAYDLYQQLIPRNSEPMATVEQKNYLGIPLTMRLHQQADTTTIIWDSHVIGTCKSQFTMPYYHFDVPLIMRALDAAQYPNHPLYGPQFSEEEQQRLNALGLWAYKRVSEDVHERVGRAIYDALIKDPNGAEALNTVRNYATSQGLSVRYILRFPPEVAELAMLPWELLWDKHSAVLLSRGQVASLERYIEFDYALLPANESKSTLRILALSPRAGISESVRREERNARNTAFTQLIQTSRVEIDELEPVTLPSLVDRIQVGKPVDVVHFYGHGRYKNGRGELLVDTPSGQTTWISAQRLATLLGNTRMVVLHACQSAMIDDTEVWSGVGHALSAAGVPIVIAMQFTIRISAATRFAEILYRSIAQGQAVQQAVNNARQALYIEEDDGASWYVPSLIIRRRESEPVYIL